MAEFDTEKYKDRLQAKVEQHRKQREKRFLRLAWPTVFFISAVFLFFTAPGREVLGQLLWLGEDDALLARWFIAYALIGGLITLGVDWLVRKAEEDRKSRD